MSNRFTTGSGPWLTSSEVETDLINKGGNTVEVWEGSETECKGYEDYLIASGAKVLKIAPKGDGNWTIRATFPFNKDNPDKQPYVDVLELEVNVINRSWENSPIFRSNFDDYSSTTQYSAKAYSVVTVIRELLHKQKSGGPKTGSDGNSLWRGTSYSTKELALDAEWIYRRNLISGLTPTEKTASSNLFNLVVFGSVNSFLEYNHVFRRRVTAGSPDSIRANNVGAGKIWTTAEVVSWEGIPQNGWFDLPVDVQWHKDKPRVTASYGQRTEISYSYTEIVTASSLFYEAYGSATLI